MKISSAYDDFCARTLAALGGVWARLRYVAELRAPGGGYRHWGLVRTFGDHAAQRAVAQAHTELFLEILRTPLRRLAADDSPADGLELSAYLPEDPGGGASEHFSSVVSALAALAEVRRSSPHRAA